MLGLVKRERKSRSVRSNFLRNDFEKDRIPPNKKREKKIEKK